MSILSFILANLFNGLMGIGFLLLGYKLFSWITKWNFREVLDDEKGRNGISGGSVVIAAFFVSLAIIIAAAAF